MKCRNFFLSRGERLSCVILNEPLKCFFALNRYAFLKAFYLALGQGRCENIKYFVGFIISVFKNCNSAAVITKSVFFG